MVSNKKRKIDRQNLVYLTWFGYKKCSIDYKIPKYKKVEATIVENKTCNWFFY